MPFKSLLLVVIAGVLLIGCGEVQNAETKPEPRLIVYREIGEDGNPTDPKTLTLWNYPKPTNQPLDSGNPPKPAHQEEQWIPEEEPHQTQDNGQVIEDVPQMTVTQIVEVMATVDHDPQPSQNIPEVTPINTVIDPPKETVVDPNDDQPTITTFITETISSTVTVSTGTSMTTITITKGVNDDDDGILQNSSFSTFSIASSDLLFRANRGQKHNTDSLLCIMIVMAAVLGVL